MIDDSPAGSWAAILPYCTHIKVSEVSAPLRTLAAAASLMGKHGAVVRRDRERARIMAKTNEMRADLGWEPIA